MTEHHILLPHEARCPTCGRIITRNPEQQFCYRCVQRGYVAERLFDEDDRG